MNRFNEYSRIKTLALRKATDAFRSEDKLKNEWQDLRFHAKPDLTLALEEYAVFEGLFQEAKISFLSAKEQLSLDAIYTRDAIIISPKGLILCHMGRKSRRSEPKANSDELLNFKVLGEIQAPGTLEGGDFIWLNENHAAVGLGPRTNEEGIKQLKALLGSEVDLHVIPLPAPDHPDDVFHLMSMISPLDKDLALIYRPLMPKSFLNWLEEQGISFVDVAESEFLDMACNILAIGPRDLVMLDGLPLTHKRLVDLGCKVQVYKGNEISRKGEGGPTCLTRPLVRED